MGIGFGATGASAIIGAIIGATFGGGGAARPPATRRVAVVVGVAARTGLALEAALQVQVVRGGAWGTHAPTLHLSTPGALEVAVGVAVLALPVQHLSMTAVAHPSEEVEAAEEAQLVAAARLVSGALAPCRLW